MQFPGQHLLIPNSLAAAQLADRLAADNLAQANLGPELVGNGDFGGTVGASPGGWLIATSGTATIANTTPPSGFTQYAEVVSGDGNYDRLEQNSSNDFENLTIGATYRVRVLARSVVGTHTDQGLFAFSFTNGAENVPFTAAGTWEWLEVDVVATATSGKIRLYCSRAGTIGDQVDVAYISMKQVY